MRQAEHAKVARTLNDLYGYLEANRDLIVDYGDRRRHGESISSSLAESSINQIVANRSGQRLSTASCARRFDTGIQR